MARPAKLSGSRFPYARKVVPQDVRAILGRVEFKRPLRGTDPPDIRRLHREAMADFEAQIEAARAKLTVTTRRLTAQEVAALCGEHYRERLRLNEAEPGNAAAWEAEHDRLLDMVAHEPEEPVPAFEPSARDLSEADAWLIQRGIAADPETVYRTAVELWTAKVQFAETMLHRAHGDWQRDDYGHRFPMPDAPVRPAAHAPESPSEAPLTFAALVEAWATERQPPAKSRAKWDAAFANLAAVIGHDDARRVSAD